MYINCFKNISFVFFKYFLQVWLLLLAELSVRVNIDLVVVALVEDLEVAPEDLEEVSEGLEVAVEDLEVAVEDLEVALEDL